MSFLTPLFIWTDAMLKGGKHALDSMQAVARSAKSPRVGVIPTADAPTKGAAGGRKARAKAKSEAKARRR
jgi:hypothetical protein